MECVPRKQMDDRSKLIRSYHALYCNAKRRFMEMHAYDFYKAGLTVEEISEIMCVPQESIDHAIRHKQAEKQNSKRLFDTRRYIKDQERKFKKEIAEGIQHPM